jgi:hypothetical protein
MTSVPYPFFAVSRDLEGLTRWKAPEALRSSDSVLLEPCKPKTSRDDSWAQLAT